MQLKQKQSSTNSMVKDVLRFAQVFSQMIHLGVDIAFKDFLIVMESTANDIESILTRLNSKGEFSQKILFFLKKFFCHI